MGLIGLNRHKPSYAKKPMQKYDWKRDKNTFDQFLCRAWGQVQLTFALILPRAKTMANVFQLIRYKNTKYNFTQFENISGASLWLHWTGLWRSLLRRRWDCTWQIAFTTKILKQTLFQWFDPFLHIRNGILLRSESALIKSLIWIWPLLPPAVTICCDPCSKIARGGAATFYI